MSTTKRPYRSRLRQAQAEETRKRILASASEMFSEAGFGNATIARIAEHANVSAPLVYALFKSKEGLLRALIDSTVFGARYQALVQQLGAEHDPVGILKLVSRITRSIYDAEKSQIGFVQRVGIVSPAIEQLERELEQQRYDRQEMVVRRLFDAGEIRSDLEYPAARDIMWALTGSELYRMMIVERGWTGDEYENWLGDLLVHSLLEARARASN